MKQSTHVSIDAGERFLINGAVLRADRKVALEVLGAGIFLREHQVMQPEAADTPLRQLYFVVQTMFIDPSAVAGATALYNEMMLDLAKALSNVQIITGLMSVQALVDAGRLYDALLTIRSLFALEQEILASDRISERLEAAS